jgi:glucose-6-phosphate 1-dehydrogenase
VRLATTLNGPEQTAENRQLEARSTPPRFTAYARLIQEMLKGDPMLFIRGDEAEEAWRIIDPVMGRGPPATSRCRSTPSAQRPRPPRFDGRVTHDQHLAGWRIDALEAAGLWE